MIRIRSAYRRTLERLVIESRMRRFREDHASFFAECVQVPDPGSKGGRTSFVPYDYQRDDIGILKDNRYVIVLKARQLGLTTLVMAFVLHHLMFFPGANVILVSKDQDTANSALDLLDFMWTFLPKWFRSAAPRLSTDNATEKVFTFENGMTSRIISRPATKTVGAGEVASIVVWDEAALAEQQPDTLRSLQPTTDRGGKMIVFSTARGGYNTFAQMFRQAYYKASEFVPIFHPWYVSRLINPLAENVASCEWGTCEKCVDYTRYNSLKSDFKDKPHLFYSERPASIEEAFSSSGHLRFAGLPSVDKFKDFPNRGYLRESGGEVYFVPSDDGPLWLTDEAVDGAPRGTKPVIACDPATGVGQDYTAAFGGWVDHAGRPTLGAMWHDNRTEMVSAAAELGLLGRFLATEHGDALLAVEKAGGFGLTMIQELISDRINYMNMYVSTTPGKFRGEMRDTTFGFPMSTTRRPMVIERLAEWLPSIDDPDREVIQNIPKALRDELGAFVVHENGKIQADVGMHDDLVLAAAVWIYIVCDEHNLVATFSPQRVEEPSGPKVKTYSIQHIWDRAESLRAENARNQLKDQRRYQRRALKRAKRSKDA